MWNMREVCGSGAAVQTERAERFEAERHIGAVQHQICMRGLPEYPGKHQNY